MAGRPKGSTANKIWATALRRASLERTKGQRHIDIAAKAMVKRAMDGDSSVFREYGDRIDGKVPTPLVGEDNGPISVTLRVFGNAAK